MKYNKNNKPIVCMMTNSTCYKGTKEFVPKGILWHSTGANNPTIKRYVQPTEGDSNYNDLMNLIGKNQYGNDWNHISRNAGLNAWIGKLADGTVATVQTMPWNYRPWGCGVGSKGSCNDGWVQFEICEDSLTDATYFNKVYKEACELTAYLCDLYNIDPNGTINHNGVTVPTILCHYDSYKLGLGSNHGDVLHWFKKHGKTMDDVRKDVLALMNGAVEPPRTPKKPDVIYQVYADGKWWSEITNYNEINSNGYAGVFGKEISGIRVRLSNGKTVTVRSHISGNARKNWLAPIKRWGIGGNGYSGWKNRPTDCIAMRADGCTLKYRVHVKGGQWLNWVSKYDINDYVNGLAGIYGKPIDAVQITVV